MESAKVSSFSYTYVCILKLYVCSGVCVYSKVLEAKPCGKTNRSKQSVGNVS